MFECRFSLRNNALESVTRNALSQIAAPVSDAMEDNNRLYRIVPKMK